MLRALCWSGYYGFMGFWAKNGIEWMGDSNHTSVRQQDTHRRCQDCESASHQRKNHSLLKIPNELSSRRCYHISDVLLLTEKREKKRRRTRNTVCTVNWTQDSLRPSVDFSVWNSKNFSSICDSLLSRTTFPFVCSSLYFSRIWYTLKHIKFIMKHVFCQDLKIGRTGPIKVMPKR